MKADIVLPEPVGAAMRVCRPEAIAGQPSFDDLSFTINGSKFAYGHWINALITFLITAVVLFMIVRSVVRIQGLFARAQPPPEPALLELEAGLAACRPVAGVEAEPVSAEQAEDLLLLDGFIRRPPPELAVLPLERERIAAHHDQVLTAGSG